VAKGLSKAAKAAMKASAEREGASRALEALDAGFRARVGHRFAKKLSEPNALEQLLAALKDDAADVRADAAEALGELGDAAAVKALRGCLGDADGEVRTRAAVALIRIGDEVLFPEVVKALRHSDARVVIGAAVVLGHLADARVVPNLVEAFKTEDPQVGAAIAWAIGQCQDAAALPWLVTALEQGFATANVCEALGRLGDARARPVLEKALAYPSEDTRAYAARALGLIHDPPPTPPTILDALRKLLDDKARKVRLCAAIALHELGDGDASARLADALR
jgi:HEAT repeat protein